MLNDGVTPSAHEGQLQGLLALHSTYCGSELLWYPPIVFGPLYTPVQIPPQWRGHPLLAQLPQKSVTPTCEIKSLFW